MKTEGSRRPFDRNKSVEKGNGAEDAGEGVCGASLYQQVFVLEGQT